MSGPKVLATNSCLQTKTREIPQGSSHLIFSSECGSVFWIRCSADVWRNRKLPINFRQNISPGRDSKWRLISSSPCYASRVMTPEEWVPSFPSKLNFMRRVWMWVCVSMCESVRECVSVQVWGASLQVCGYVRVSMCVCVIVEGERGRVTRDWGGSAECTIHSKILLLSDLKTFNKWNLSIPRN